MFNKGMNRNREGFAIVMLLGHMANVGFDNIPPVTLISIIGQMLLYVRVVVIPYRSRVEDVCISASAVWYGKDWPRLIFGAIQHADEWHLYYNMVSFLWKGRKIEQHIGTPRFGVLLAIFTPLVSLVLLGLIGVSQLIFDDPWNLDTCHVGFSGVLFALKVLLNYQEPHVVHFVMGSIPVSASMVYWVELLLIHIMLPNSSFLGHLAGILVGLFYVHTTILKALIDTISRTFISGSPFREAPRRRSPESESNRSYQYHQYSYYH